MEGNRETPWDWDFLSTKPSDPARIKLLAVWGSADTAVGKCSGSSLNVDFIGEITNEQIKESKQNLWPYNECEAQSQGKSVTPFTEACYEASKEMSTLRKYRMTITHENVIFDLFHFSFLPFCYRNLNKLFVYFSFLHIYQN